MTPVDTVHRINTDHITTYHDSTSHRIQTVLTAQGLLITFPRVRIYLHSRFCWVHFMEMFSRGTLKKHDWKMKDQFSRHCKTSRKGYWVQLL